MKKWKVLQHTTIWERPWFALHVDRVETARGVVLDEYPLIHSRDWVCVVAITHAHQVVLVRQYRHGVGTETLELPAGGVDPGEPPLQAARRELAEETGYAATEWHHLRSVSPEPTRRHHLAHLFLALGARPVSGQQLEACEDVEVELRAWDDTAGLARELSHAVHIAAVYLARDHLGGSRPVP